MKQEALMGLLWLSSHNIVGLEYKALKMFNTSNSKALNCNVGCILINKSHLLRHSSEPLSTPSHNKIQIGHILPYFQAPVMFLQNSAR